MHLWTEYEGNTLAGYPLGRLYRSEGRSAFFLTSDAQGQPAMLRLTESHFDEGELVARWQKIAAVPHPNLQAIGYFGRTTFDSVSLACCLLEPADASLSDVLRERALSSDEAKQVAEAVAGALAALHAAGLVHEHVDATNIFAMGETVKLRSDCARECTGDFEADTPEAREALRQRDVHDLGLLLLRCLNPDGQGDTPQPLARPFDGMVPRLLDGTLRAEGVAAILNPAPAVPPVRPQPLHEDVAATYVAGVPADAADGSSVPSRPIYAGMPKPLAKTTRTAAPVAGSTSSEDPFTSGPRSLRDSARDDAATSSAGEGGMRRPGLMPGTIGTKVWIASGCAAALLAFILWGTAGSTKHAAPEARPLIASTPPAPPQTTGQAPGVHRPAGTSAIARQGATQGSLLASGMQAGWHVIAYTYNYERQAQAKVEQLKRRYVGLQPQVFSPTGRAPYFVALGGPSDSVRAMALRNRARQAGLPRDTYARNF